MVASTSMKCFYSRDEESKRVVGWCRAVHETSAVRNESLVMRPVYDADFYDSRFMLWMP